MPYNYNPRYKRYKKRYKRRSSAYHSKTRSSRYLGYAGSAVSTASKALAVAYGIKRLLNVEFKFHDVQLTLTPVTIAPIITQLTNIAQGDTDQTRDGAQVKLTRLNIKLYIQNNSGSNSTAMRIMIVHDKQTNQAIYADTDLLSDVTANDGIVSSLNLDNKYRFEILYNKVVTMQNVGNSTHYLNIKKELDLRLRFDASTPSIADLTSSSLSIVFISSTTANPIVTMFARLRYVDN